MERDERSHVAEVEAALTGGGTVALGPGVAECGSWRERGVPYRERELAAFVRAASAPSIVVVAHVGATLLRALREAPPALLVWIDDTTSPHDPLVRELSQRTWLLGPGAELEWDPLAWTSPFTIATAHCRAELEGLRRSLRNDDRAPLALALAPTPTWLCTLLHAPRFAAAEVLGTIDAEHLHAGWVRWVHSHERQVLVPVGLPDADLENPLALQSHVAAQALERWTGPVFPSPRVIAAVARGLSRLRHRGRLPVVAPRAEALATWAQARRALPWLGDLPDMDAPDPAETLDAPTSSFLAQAALLRARTRLVVREQEPPASPAIEPEGIQRALEVLRAAGDRLSDQESKVVLRGFGFEVTRQALANSASGASGFAERIGFPVVLKALSPDLRRRSDVGGILLNLETSAAVRRGYATIVDNVERGAPTAHLDGVLVAEMVADGIDLRVGGRRLPSGDVILYGRVESPAGVRSEPSLALASATPAAALEMAHAILQSAWIPVRRHDDPDPRALAQLLLMLSVLLEQTEGRIVALDLGPVRWVGNERGYVTLDASITQRPHLQGL